MGNLHRNQDNTCAGNQGYMIRNRTFALFAMPASELVDTTNTGLV